MAVSTNKKVTCVRFDRELLTGFVQPATYLQPEGVELLSPGGTVTLVPYLDIKCICFVRDWDGAERILEKRTFVSRPKQEGLWVRFFWRDGEMMEALLPNRLLEIEGTGFTVVPPDSGGNAQKLFLPRPALKDMQVLGVVGGAQLRQQKKPKPPVPNQIQLFE
ncbi:MAG: hypothetical protein K2X03_10180 [Bryobacteraceae bacterium]|nr:hypothetical protein [Bryobacteraceae bacterium]